MRGGGYRYRSNNLGTKPMTLPTTHDRVPGSTADDINRRIDQEIADNVREATAQGRLPQRIGELDAEWDIERASR